MNDSTQTAAERRTQIKRIGSSQYRDCHIRRIGHGYHVTWYMAHWAKDDCEPSSRMFHTKEALFEFLAWYFIEGGRRVDDVKQHLTKLRRELGP